MIEGAVREGVLNGVYMFLENECGWDYLYNGPSELQETDHLVIGEDISAEAVPAFEFFLTSYRKTEVLPLGNDKTFIEQLSKDFFSIYSYPVRHANHGMDKNNWANFDPHYVQICYTNEGNLDTVVSRIVEHLDAKEAAGDIIGETVRFIDIAQGDNGRYCLCNSCMEVLGIEKSHTGAVVRFANEVATQVNELFPGAEAVICGDLQRLSAYVTIGSEDYVCVMTRGHAYDTVVQAQVLRCRPTYCGVIGSAFKAAGVRKTLKEEYGLSDEELDLVTTPIGLNIKGETPAEIAISIAAQMIPHRAERNGL